MAEPAGGASVDPVGERLPGVGPVQPRALLFDRRRHAVQASVRIFAKRMRAGYVGASQPKPQGIGLIKLGLTIS